MGPLLSNTSPVCSHSTRRTFETFKLHLSRDVRSYTAILLRLSLPRTQFHRIHRVRERGFSPALRRHSAPWCTPLTFATPPAYAPSSHGRYILIGWLARPTSPMRPSNFGATASLFSRSATLHLFWT